MSAGPEVGMTDERDGKPVVVLAPTEIDPATCDALAESLAGAGSSADVLVDFSDVAFCDSSGLRVLIVAAKRQAANGRSLRITNVSPRVARVFEITGLTGLMVPA